MISSDLGFVLASTTFKCVISEVGNSYETTQVTHMAAVRIRTFKQAFVEELSCTMRYLAIPFHFSKTQATIAEGKTEPKKNNN